jgi:hypothetical protein
MDYVIRKANLDDRAAIAQLIKESARYLSRHHYSEQQIEGAIKTVRSSFIRNTRERE